MVPTFRKSRKVGHPVPTFAQTAKVGHPQGVGIFAVTWFEGVLSSPLVLTAVVT